MSRDEAHARTLLAAIGIIGSPLLEVADQQLKVFIVKTFFNLSLHGPTDASAYFCLCLSVSVYASVCVCLSASNRNNCNTRFFFFFGTHTHTLSLSLLTSLLTSLL